MKTWFDKLNLRPHERRLVVIAGLVIFVLLNIWFIFPYFSDWGTVQNDLSKNQATLAKYQAEIARRDQYAAEEKKLETTGSDMLTSETDFQRIISSNAVANGIQVTSLTAGKQSMGAKTNQFFQEGSISIAFTSGGKELIDFLVAIAAQNTMIRVREMNVRPDPSQTKLAGTIVFAGNYARPQANPAPANRGTASPRTPARQSKPPAKPAERKHVVAQPPRRNT